MGRVEIRPATASRWSDLRRVLNPNDNPRHCWCLSWRLSSSEFRAAQGGERMRELMAADPAPGLLAYLDGETVGCASTSPTAPTYPERVHGRRSDAGVGGACGLAAGGTVGAVG